MPNLNFGNIIQNYAVMNKNVSDDCSNVCLSAARGLTALIYFVSGQRPNCSLAMGRSPLIRHCPKQQ